MQDLADLANSPKDTCHTPSAITEPQGGIGFFATPNSTFMADDVVLRYQVAFHDNWNPVRGGKLPGLYIGQGQSGADMVGASGGCHTDNASLRLAWRADMSAEVYLYVPEEQTPEYLAQLASKRAISEASSVSDLCETPNKVYGDLLWKDAFSLRTGVGNWNDIAIRIKMNSFDPSTGAPLPDGLVAVSVNNVTRSFDKMVWRTSPDFHINALLFTTFFGGSSIAYATPVDTWSYYRNMSLEKLG